MGFYWLPALAVLAQLAAPGENDGAYAAIRLYNPTAWHGAVPVEVPVGRVAAPGLIDWSRARLVAAGKEIPFALREGRSHWRARIGDAATAPRAEDLLVFSCAVPPGEWVRVDVVPGGAPGAAQTEGADGILTATHGDGRIAVDERTGMLRAWDVAGRSMLAAPFAVTPVRLGEDGYRLEGYFSVGYCTAAIGIDQGAPAPVTARPAGSVSTPAMTELRFVLEVEDGPSLLLAYRLHASGLLEIVADERPWEGTSPWLGHAVDYTLELAGHTATPFPLLEDRWAFYGFREYTAAVKSVARLHADAGGGTVELGEQTVNGRRFLRRLFPVSADRIEGAKDLVELADEGLVVEVQPFCTPPVTGSVRIADDGGSFAVASELVEALEASGIRVVADADAYAIRLDRTEDPGKGGIEGDGFTIVAEGDGLVLRAGTRLGHYGAVREVARHLQRHGRDGGFPQVARNPVADLRGGGFGGGNFEVDFPYETDEEWFRVFDNLLDSGMNVFACMGMWANWKMPVDYRYMPELRSDDPEAYDESSGAKFAELEHHREHGLKLARYLQDRGGQVWLWVPIGCVPTTFSARFPEAMAPGSDLFPCFTHPRYREYIDAFFRELLETYPLDGLFLVRDDNGGVCSCDRCARYIAESRTKSPVWEQYIVIYDWLRDHGFQGAVAVYPYHDWYEPKLDPFLPDDLYVVGHGAGAAVLARDYACLGPMGDTWLDNLYANFRVPPSPRMRRLLADRGSFWIGGAYVGCELPWEAIGHFGWEPTATPNSLRHAWAARELGLPAALPFVAMNDVYEALWDINALYMPPADWMKLEPERRAAVVRDGQAGADRLRARLADLERSVDRARHARWLGHMRLFAPFFEYHLHRLDRFAKVYDRVSAHREALDTEKGLPPDVRRAVLDDYAAIYEVAGRYDAAMKEAPGGMLDHCRWMTAPYKEWMAGYDQWLDAQLDLKQFAGSATVETKPLRPGEPFTLRVTLKNRGACPWVEGAGHRLELSGDAALLGLPETLEFHGEPIAPGDRYTIEIPGTGPQDAGKAKVTAAFLSPYRVPDKFIVEDIDLSWE